MSVRLSSLLIPFAGLGLLIAAIALRSGPADRRVSVESYEHVYMLPPPVWLGPMSLGYRAALADLIWARALVYFGEELQHRSAANHVFSYGEAIVALDPDFRAAYSWAGSIGIYRPTDVPTEDFHRAVDFLERLVSRFPSDGHAHWDLGATLAFELAPRLSNGPIKNDILARGASEMIQAQHLGAAPDWAVLSSTSMLQRIGRTEEAARGLEAMYGVISDESVRAEIAERIASLRTDAYRDAFASEVEHNEGLRREHVPYVSPAFFDYLGPPFSISERAWLEHGPASVFPQSNGLEALAVRQ